MVLRMLLGTLALSIMAMPARALDCRPEQMLAQVQMEPNADRSREFVPVTINGFENKLLLDTGGYLTQLSIEAVSQMKPSQKPGTGLADITGKSRAKVVHLDNFELGNMRAHDLEVSIFPSPRRLKKSHADGLLAPDLMYAYDVDLDFGADLLKFYAQDHCEGPPDAWRDRDAAIIPFQVISGHIVLPVTLDGTQVQAIMDTGAPVTTVGFRTLHLMDLDAVYNKQTECKERTFASLSFGGVTVNNPTLPVIGTAQEASVGRKSDMLIGMTILRRLHIYVAFKERKLYVAGATPRPIPADAVPAEPNDCKVHDDD
jgi:predicted aspartyl protease